MAGKLRLEATAERRGCDSAVGPCIDAYDRVTMLK